MDVLKEPSSIESEKIVLGCMLGNFDSMTIGVDSIEAEDFFYSNHKLIFTVIRYLYASDKNVAIHTVAEEIIKRDQAILTGGVHYLTELVQGVGTGSFIEDAIDTVKDKAALRRIVEISYNTQKQALKGIKDPYDIVNEAQEGFFKISQTKNTGSAISLKDIVCGEKAKSKLSFMVELAQRQEKYELYGDTSHVMSGIPTGFIDLDKVLDGLNRSNLIILAARPAMGKTAFAINIAEHVAFKNDIPVGIFSLEMSAEQLVNRIISSQSEVPATQIKKGCITGNEFQKINSTIEYIKQKKMIIDDQPGLKVTDLRSRARRMKEIDGVGLIIVDYLQLLSGPSSSSSRPESRQVEISEISRMLKNIAKELDIPILCLSQLSRKIEERVDKTPMLSDLRESGAIEQDADQIMFISRDDMDREGENVGLAKIYVRKNRHGETRDIKLTFRGNIVKFGNYTPYAQDDDESSSNKFNNW